MTFTNSEFSFAHAKPATNSHLRLRPTPTAWYNKGQRSASEPWLRLHIISNLIFRPANLLRSVVAFFIIFSALRPASLVRAQNESSHRVTWDSHSLFIDGHRLLLYSGEFHYWRLPSRSLWQDRLQKMKAVGLNAVSIYFDWQYHSSAPGQYDFSGVRDIDYLLSLTERLGLYVVARVGPYMNAEVDAGGLPGWVLTKALYPRSQSWDGTTAHAHDSPLYEQYSKEWYDHLLPILARHQVTSGGSVLLLSIENEYNQDTGSSTYMQDLYHFARDDGITVPIFHNDYYFKGDWSKLVDLYAYDSYPYGFSCCHQWWDLHFHGIDTWEQQLRSQLKLTTPMFVSELQGGAFQPWGGKAYGEVAKTLGPDWLTDVDQSALAQGATLLNTYMFTGGTTWGYMSGPGAFTSYDYGAPISEAGVLRPAYYAAHRLGLFLQSYGAILAGATAAPSAVTASNPAVVVHSRLDPVSGQLFTFLRHGDAGEAVNTRLTLAVGSKVFSLPQRKSTFITLPGHGAALLTANVQTGPLHLNYSTSQVLMDTDTTHGHYLVLYGPDGTSGETDFALPSTGASVVHNADVTVTRSNGELRLNYRHTAQPREISIASPTGALHIIVTNAEAAGRYWSQNGMIIAGPDLVTADNGSITVQTSRQRDVRVYGASNQRSLIVDGHATALPDAINGTTLLGRLQGPSPLSLPVLSHWKFAPESPEVSPNFDDSGWMRADHTSTTNPNVPASTTLLADDYGFHYGFVWYRGHFQATGTETGIAIAARQCYSVYLNGVYLGGGDASLADPPHPYALAQTFQFPVGSLRIGTDNVVSVLTESMGHDEGWIAGPVAQSPQGILSAQLTGSPTPVNWRIQGDIGGETPLDAERGLLNASGLYGERRGWYLPQFDDSAWQSVTPPDDWKTRGVTSDLGWYRTRFQLNEPDGASAPIALTLPHASDKAYIWLNGWLLGRYWEQEGPQHAFYLPDGILNPHGDNVLVIAVWNRGHDGGLTTTPTLGVYTSLVSHSLSVGSLLDGASGYWHTSGDRIVDGHGVPVRIAAVNWSGMQGSKFVPAGLDRQPLDSIMSRIQAFGFNAIRLPFSNQLVERNPQISAGVEANPELRGLPALSVMDRIVASAGQHGLRVILDDHRSNAGVDPQENGLWYTQGYAPSTWIRDWATLAARYKDNPTVVGVDLRDEPHTGPPGPWSTQTYLHQGATWGPYLGVENEASDWRLAAQRGGDAVLKVNPHLLIFVEGIQQYPDSTQAGGIDSYWWGGVFQPAAQYPLQLSVPNQLVYSPHEYGPQKYQMPFFGARMSYDSLSQVWRKHWDFLEEPSYSARAPIFIGEFGTCGQSPDCVKDGGPGSQGRWFSYFMRYLREHPQISWCFWALNGTNSSGHVQPNYVLNTDWHTPRLRQLIDALRDVETPPPPA